MDILKIQVKAGKPSSMAAEKLKRLVYGNSHWGYTLVELMVVVLILGALAFVVIPRIGESSNLAKVNACNANVKIMNKKLELFNIRTGDWPQNYNKFSTNLDYFPDGPPECPYGTNYKIDSGLERIIPHAH